MAVREKKRKRHRTPEKERKRQERTETQKQNNTQRVRGCLSAFSAKAYKKYLQPAGNQ